MTTATDTATLAETIGHGSTGTATERVVILGDNREVLSMHVHAVVFGIMMNLARPVVRLYLSDYYHDALWLSEYLAEDVPWFYGVRDTGTSIGRDRDLTAAYNPHAYRLALSRTDRHLVLTVTLDTEPRTR